MGEIVSVIVGFFHMAWKWLLAAVLVLLLLGKIGSFLGPTDQLRHADAIVAISGGDTSARAGTAIDLYKQGWAPTLIFSGAALDPLSPSNASVMRNWAVSQGVPSDAIQVEGRAVDTTQNAVRSTAILKDLGVKTVILVTSGYHQRRAAMEFRQAAGKNIAIINYPTDDRDWSSHWWLTPKGWWLALTELIKITATWLHQQI